MEKLLIILLPSNLYVYKYNKLSSGFKSELIYINGEATFGWRAEWCQYDFEQLREELLGIANLDNTSEVYFDVVYHQVHMSSVMHLTNSLNPCRSWQVFSFEKILPELLLKMKVIVPNKNVVVSFEGNNYSVKMDSQGYIKVCRTKSKSKIVLDHKDMPSILNMNYEFLNNISDPTIALEEKKL